LLPVSSKSCLFPTSLRTGLSLVVADCWVACSVGLIAGRSWGRCRCSVGR
jgi:hypothetical protein